MLNTAGIVTTVAGGGTNLNGDGGRATGAFLASPVGVALDSSGNLYIANNSAIRKVTAQVTPPANPPSFTESGVVNGASFAPGGVVAGEIATIFGSNLTSSTGINLTSSLPIPTDFENVSVTVNGVNALLFAVDNVNGQQQINFLANLGEGKTRNYYKNNETISSQGDPADCLVILAIAIGFVLLQS